MLLEILAVLIVTFFASLGMIEASQWLLRQSIKCNMKKCVFFIADVSSVNEETLEESVRAALAEADPVSGKVILDDIPSEVILDCRAASAEAKRICFNLCRRFYCTAAENEKELETALMLGLQNEEKDI